MDVPSSYERFWVRGFIPTDLVVDSDGRFWLCERDDANSQGPNRLQPISDTDVAALCINARYAYINDLVQMNAEIINITPFLIKCKHRVDATVGDTVKIVLPLENMWIKVYAIEESAIIGFAEANAMHAPEFVSQQLVAFDVEYVHAVSHQI